MAEEWRRVIAALVNPSLRRAFAEVVHGDADGIRRKDLAALTAAGLLRAVDDGAARGIRVDEEALRSLLVAPVARPERTGLDRFLRADGRVDRDVVDESLVGRTRTGSSYRLVVVPSGADAAGSAVADADTTR